MSTLTVSTTVLSELLIRHFWATALRRRLNVEQKLCVKWIHMNPSASFVKSMADMVSWNIVKLARKMQKRRR
jgi:hypothetical protein